MKHDMEFKHSGKCFICGEDTQLLIHQECGKKMDEKRKLAKAKKYSDKYVDYLSNIDH